MAVGAAQGKGQGVVQPTTNSTLQPGATIFNGVVTPNTIGPNGQPVGGTMPTMPTQVPPQGGKGGVRQPVQPRTIPFNQVTADDFIPRTPTPTMDQTLSTISGLPQQPTYLPVGTPLPGGPVTQAGIDQAKIMNAGKGVGTVQPGQVPAQGGKGGVQQPQGPRPFDETGSLRQDPRVAQLINQGNMQGARDLQNQLAREKGLGGTLPQIPTQGRPLTNTPQNTDVSTISKLTKMLNDRNRAQAGLPMQPANPTPQIPGARTTQGLASLQANLAKARGGR